MVHSLILVLLFTQFAFAAALIPNNSIINDKLVNNTILSNKINDGTIVSADISDAAIISAKIADAAVSTSKILDGAVTEGKINASAVTAAKIADGAVTQAKRAALGQQLSASSGAFSVTSSSLTDVTNLSVTITTTGRPVFVGTTADGTTSNSYVWTTSASASSADIAILRGATVISLTRWASIAGGSNSIPAGGAHIVDVVGAGTYTYKVQVRASSGGIYVENVKLIAFEL